MFHAFAFQIGYKTFQLHGGVGTLFFFCGNRGLLCAGLFW
jgi:hypothetical protein